MEYGVHPSLTLSFISHHHQILFFFFFFSFPPSPSPSPSRPPSSLSLLHLSLVTLNLLTRPGHRDVFTHSTTVSRHSLQTRFNGT